MTMFRIICTVMILCVCIYLGAFAYLTKYLRRVYTTTWVELGEFTLRDARRHQLEGLFEWYVAGLRTLGFALFSKQYRAVQD